MDPLQLFVIAIIWAIASWINRKGEAKATEQEEQWADQQLEEDRGRPQETAPAKPRQPSPTASGWEEELRRLLEGEVAPAEPKPQPRPADPTPQQQGTPPPLPGPPPAPRAVPLPVSIPIPEPVRQPEPVQAAARTETHAFAPPKLVSDIDGDYFHKGACVHCGGRLLFPDGAIGHDLNCPHCSKDTPLRPLQPSELAGGPRPYARKRKPAETMASEIAGLFSSPDSAQKAVVASIVFGPPKALQEDGKSALF